MKQELTKNKTRQISIFANDDYPTYEEIIWEYAKEFNHYIIPKGDNIFGFWMQTLADLELLDLELLGLTEKYEIDPINRKVEFVGDPELIRLRIAHLEKVEGRTTLYTELVDLYNDTNAYAFHNLYPYKGKFYPRVVRTLINAFGLNQSNLILDPFNGSGTTTHEATLMGIESVGIDVTPIGVIISKLKNELPFLSESELDFTNQELMEILHLIEKKEWKHSDETIHNLMLIIYFDTADAFARTSKYNSKGKVGLFIEKFHYIKECHKKLSEIKKKYNLNFKRARNIEGDILELKKNTEFENKFDAIITSPPYYFSIDYVGKDKIAYDYLGIDMKEIESHYLGMKNTATTKRDYGHLPQKVALYYDDLKKSIENMYWALKPGGKIAIIIGDSTVNGRKIPTTMMTKRFCEKIGFKFIKLIFNPLLGVRNRAIRGESIIICEKEQ